MTNPVLLGTVAPVQAAAEALEHFKKRSNQPEESLPKCMAQLICQLHVIAEQERIDFRSVLLYASGLARAESVRTYENLKAGGLLGTPGGGK